MMKLRNHSDVSKIYSPANWAYVLNNAEKAYTADCPTLWDIFDSFGREYAELWIMQQVLALYGASSSKELGIVDGIKIFSQAFSSQVKTYKLTELMLFFARYEAGRYDASFSCFDTRRIGSAFFREFLPERRNEITVIKRRMTMREMKRRQFVAPEGYTSLSWYEELKRRARNGDNEAIKLLYHHESDNLLDMQS